MAYRAIRHGRETTKSLIGKKSKYTIEIARGDKYFDDAYILRVYTDIVRSRQECNVKVNKYTTVMESYNSESVLGMMQSICNGGCFTKFVVKKTRNDGVKYSEDDSAMEDILREMDENTSCHIDYEII